MRDGRTAALIAVMLGGVWPVGTPAVVEAQARRGPPPVPPDASPPMTVEAYDPRSTLVVPENPVSRAAFPFVDVHLHLNGLMPRAQMDQLVRDMDALNLAVGVNLSGGSGTQLARQVEAFEAAYPGRFVVFANVDFSDIADPEFGALAAARLEADVAAGARGLKIFKSLGLWITDAAGQRVPVDDARLDPIWAKAGELGIPVLIHSADPAEFWEPMDERNERWLELRLRPRRRQSGPPSFEQVLGEHAHSRADRVVTIELTGFGGLVPAV